MNCWAVAKRWGQNAVKGLVPEHMSGASSRQPRHNWERLRRVHQNSWMSRLGLRAVEVLMLLWLHLYSLLVRSRTFQFYIIQGWCRPVIITREEPHSLVISDRRRPQADQAGVPRSVQGPRLWVQRGNLVSWPAVLRWSAHWVPFTDRI